MTTQRRQQIIWIVASAVVPVAVAVALLPLRDEMLSVNVALVLVLAVVALARFGGRLAGAVAAVSSTLAFDVLHTQPYWHLRIDSVDELETTLLLAAVGLTVGSIAAKERYARVTSEVLTDEVARVHRVTELVGSGATPEVVTAAVESELADLLGLRSCTFERPPFRTTPPYIDHAGRVVPLLQYRPHGEGFELPAEGVELLVENRGQTLGRFLLDPLPDRGVGLEARLSAVVLADLVGTVIGSSRDEDPLTASNGGD